MLIFGPTGPTGRIVVEGADEDGNTVTGFIRRPASLQGRHKRLLPSGGDVLDAAAVLCAAEGQNALISVNGVPSGPFSEITVYSEDTCNVVQATQKHAIPHHLRVTSWGTSQFARPCSSRVFE